MKYNQSIARLEVNPGLEVGFADQSAVELFGREPGVGASRVTSVLDLVDKDERETLAGRLNKALRMGACDELDCLMVLKGGKKECLHLGITVLFGWEKIHGLRITFTEIKNRPASDAAQADNRLEVLQRLARGTVHDLNNLLTVISGHTDLLIRKIGKQSLDPLSLKEQLELVRDAARRSGEMAGEFLYYADRRTDHKTPVDLHGLLEHIVKLLGHFCKVGVIFSKEFNAQDAMVTGDAAKLTDLFINLAFNARSALSEGGIITFSTASRVVSAPRPSPYGYDIRPGSYLVVSVGDNGMGMSREILDQLFTESFAKRINGRGMGLMNVYNTVKCHQGFIEVASRENEGTRFDINLPLIQPPIPATIATRPSEMEAELQGGGFQSGQEEESRKELV